MSRSGAEAQSDALKARGDALFRSREFVQAIAAYDEAYALSANPRLLYNKGRALQALARYGEALEAMIRFQERATPELRSEVQGLGALIEELRRKVTQLSVQVNLEGAQVTLGSDVLGTAPLAPVLVNAGTARLVVTKEGYFPYEREVTLQGGGSASFEVTLKSRAEHGKVRVLSKVRGVSVSVGGRPLGQAPAEVVLEPGTHVFLAQRSGYEDARNQLVLEPGQSRTIQLDPVERQGPIYTRFWFWTGVTVLAAGTATAIYFATRDEPRETSGNFSPDAISAPLRF